MNDLLTTMAADLDKATDILKLVASRTSDSEERMEAAAAIQTLTRLAYRYRAAAREQEAQAA